MQLLRCRETEVLGAAEQDSLVAVTRDVVVMEAVRTWSFAPLSLLLPT